MVSPDSVSAIERPELWCGPAASEMRDPVTGVLNRRGFEEEYRREVSRGSRHGEEVALALFEIVSLGTIERRHGGEGANAVLRSLAEILWRERRASDSVARLWAGQFAVLLASTSTRGAVAYVQRARARIEARAIKLPDADLGVTACAGVAVLSEAIAEGKQLLDLAASRLDQARTAASRLTPVDLR